jgi:hypothetical protein
VRKDLLIGAGSVAILLAGLWWLGRRPASESKPTAVGQEVSVFAAAPYGAGSLLSVNPPGPLRAISWMRPMADGQTLCYLSTQADQQLLGLYRDGTLQKTFTLPPVPDIDSAFFRKASLRDAASTPTLLLLLLGDEDHPKERGLLLALDPASGALRWALPASGQHLHVFGESAVLFGPDAPVTRFTWAKMKPAQTAIDLPPEIRQPEAVLPLSSEKLLVAHPSGLSAFLGSSGWNHTAAPPSGPIHFPSAHPVLIRAGHTLWWQPQPGQLFEVGSDAAIKREFLLKDLSAMPTHELDHSVLALLGADPEGHLWFGLGAPELPREDMPTKESAPSPAPEVPEAEKAAPAVSAPMLLTAEDRAAWEAYLKQPMDRLYRLSTDGKALTGFSWSERWPLLHPPAGIRPPRGDEAFAPSSGAFLLGEDQQRWYLPVASLLTGTKK